jgi:hypothetical protein
MRAGATGFAISVGLVACGAIAPPDAGLLIEDVQTTGRDLRGSLADNPAGPHVELMTGDVAGEEDGREARAVLFPLAPAQVDGSGFVVYLPAEAAVGTAIVARDADGTELGRLEYRGPALTPPDLRLER